MLFGGGVLLGTGKQVLPLESVVDLVEDLGCLCGAIELVSVVLLSRVLVAGEAVGAALEYVVDVAGADLAAAVGGDGPLLVLLERHVVVLDGLREVPALVLARPPRVCSVYVVRVDLQHRREVVNTLLQLTQLLKRATTDVEGPRVLSIQLHQRVAVLDGLCEPPFLQETRSPDEERLLMRGVLLKLFSAH